MTHEIDAVTGFCKKCGQGASLFAQGILIDCPATPNVVAISHILARNCLNRLAGKPK